MIPQKVRVRREVAQIPHTSLNLHTAYKYEMSSLELVPAQSKCHVNVSQINIEIYVSRPWVQRGPVACPFPIQYVQSPSVEWAKVTFWDILLI